MNVNEYQALELVKKILLFIKSKNKNKVELKWFAFKSQY